MAAQKISQSYITLLSWTNTEVKIWPSAIHSSQQDEAKGREERDFLSVQMIFH